MVREEAEEAAAEGRQEAVHPEEEEMGGEDPQAASAEDAERAGRGRRAAPPGVRQGFLSGGIQGDTGAGVQPEADGDIPGPFVLQGARGFLLLLLRVGRSVPPPANLLSVGRRRYVSWPVHAQKSEAKVTEVLVSCPLFAPNVRAEFEKGGALTGADRLCSKSPVAD